MARNHELLSLNKLPLHQRNPVVLIDTIPDTSKGFFSTPGSSAGSFKRPLFASKPLVSFYPRSLIHIYTRNVYG